MMTILEAILSLDPDANVTVCGGGTDDITWRDGTTAIPIAEIDAEVIRLEAEYYAQEYARKRQAEYPAIADQLDEIYHNGINAWKAVIKVTKDKYPKG